MRNVSTCISELSSILLKYANIDMTLTENDKPRKRRVDNSDKPWCYKLAAYEFNSFLMQKDAKKKVADLQIS